MDGDTRLRIWWLALASVLLVGAAADAGEWSRWSCPRSSYSAFNYLTPTAFRACAFRQKDGVFLYAPNTYPEIPLHYQDVRFRCPAVPPEQYPYPPMELNPRWPPPREDGK